MATQEDLDWLYGHDRPQQPVETARPVTRPAAPPASQPRESYVAPTPRPAPRPAPAATVPPVEQPVPPRPAPARPARPPRRVRPVHWARRIFVLLILLAICWAAFIVWTPLHWLGQVKRVDTSYEGQRPAGQVGTAILITGSDSRENLTPEQAQRLGVGGDQDEGRTDTMMLLYSPPSGNPVLISLPRDSYLPIPDNGKAKLNAAYAWGGPSLLVHTVEQNTGMRIDGYASVGFAGFGLLVDAVNGVDICVAEDIPGESVYPDIKAGCQTLDAPRALWYVRSRHSSAMQDLDRIQRQRTFLSALMKKLASPETVVNPFRYWEVNKDLSQAVVLGQDTSTQTSITMLTAMRSISQGKGTTMSMPLSDPDADTPAGSAVLWDEDLSRQLFAQLKRGDTAHLDKYQR